jgi:membrane protein
MSNALPERVTVATTLVRDIVTEFRERDVPFMAGSLAYSAFVSLLPLLLLTVIALSWLGGEELVTVVLSLTRRYLSPAGQNVVYDALTRASGRVGLSVLGFVALLWGAATLFRRLDTAFAKLYGTEDRRSIRGKLTDALVVVGDGAGDGV